MKKSFKTFFGGAYEAYKQGADFEKAERDVLDALKEFEGRLGSNKYHGGEKPDDCDFEV